MESKKELMGLFKQLKLRGFTENYKKVVCKKNQNVEETLLELCKLEVEQRYSERVKRKIKEANFPKVKTIAMLDYKLTPELKEVAVNDLENCSFIEQKENVILVGNSGTGKTHLAIGLGIEACKRDFKVKFFTACHLVNSLLKEHKEGDVERFLGKLKKYDLCIIDELGYVPFTKKGAEFLFQVFSDRYEAGSLIVTSNLNFSRWTEVFNDKTMTTALLDRVTHNATIIKYDWESVRFNQALVHRG
jgi:DNA replication protein DnaC